MKLAVAVESPAQWEWLQRIDFAARSIAVAPFFVGWDGGGGVAGRSFAAKPLAGAGLALPELSAIVEAMLAEGVDACLLAATSPGTRLVATAADLAGAAVFYLVATREQLAAVGDLPKARPDLFLVTEPGLLADALLDRRYGSTMLPVGRPGEPATADRILDAIGRWAAGDLDREPPLLSVIVPAFREAANLPLVCERLLEALEGKVASYEVLLVDDASPDDTYAVALAQMWRSPRLRALTKEPPRGMGNAIRHGLRHARAPVIAITMADGSDEVARLPEMLARVQEGFGLAIGSRYRHRQNYQTVPRLYRFWSACFRACTRLLIGLRLSDYTNAFRVFDRRIFARYGPEGGGFEISPEITFKAWFATRRVAEVDVRHLKRAAGQSSFSFLRAGPGYGKILFKAFVNRLTGRWFTLDW